MLCLFLRKSRKDIGANAPFTAFSRTAFSPSLILVPSLYLFCKKTRDVSKSCKIKKLNLTVTTNGQNDKDRLTNNQIQAADARMEHQRVMASWIKDGLS